ncbi:hypothetical protein ACWCRC_32600 [Streptomyces sp. NPDC001940]
MGQQISTESALAAFRQRCGELADENILLKALISDLEGENARLRETAPQAPTFDSVNSEATAQR